MTATCQVLRFAVFTALASSLAAFAQTHPVADLLPGHWLEISDSHMSAVDPQDDPALNPNYPLSAPWHGVEGLYGIMDDWSSGVYDTSRDQLIIWGGGHSGYAGNEIYAFDVTTLQWQRITDPSVDVSITGTTLYSDGLPRARETYNYIEYLPAFDRMMVFGGASLYPGDFTVRETIAFDFATSSWITTGFPPRPPGGYPTASIAAFDTLTGHVWFTSSGLARVTEYDPVANSWTVHASDYLSLYRRSAIDPVQRKFVRVGGQGDTLAFDLTTPDLPFVEKPTTGDTEIEAFSYPGFVFHPVRDVFVAWGEGSDVYTLDAQTWVWTRVSADPANTVAPTPPNMNGTNGRFRYIPSMDAFILVNRVDENVYFYRLPPGPGDADADGQRDDADNCLYEQNGTALADAGGFVQLDSDGDGIGNICDADIAFPNDCLVNFADVNEFGNAFLATPTSANWNGAADFNGDGNVNFLDLFILSSYFLQDYTLDNPSGITNACTSV